jgi:hypothetical protein
MMGRASSPIAAVFFVLLPLIAAAIGTGCAQLIGIEDLPELPPDGSLIPPDSMPDGMGAIDGPMLPPDAQAPDASLPPDASPVPPDAASPDAGPPDASPEPPDAEPPPDTGSRSSAAGVDSPMAISAG